MNIRRALFPCVSFVTVLFALALPSAGANIDGSLTKTVWQMKFGLDPAQVADPAWLSQDSDGDGLTNAAELIAGTDPMHANSTLVISSITAGTDTVALGFQSVAGKLYTVEWNADLAGTSGWSGFQPAVQVRGTGAALSITAPLIANAFYHVVVQDMDSDGDGVSDWAEMVTGFDPFNAHTSGATADDHTALTTQLPLENVITVRATDPSTTEPPDAATAPTSTGSITLSRGGTLNFSTITVPLQKSGTALEGSDYLGLPSSVTFLPKVGAVKIPVTPMANPGRVNNATVTMHAMPGGGYSVASPNSASVVIYPAGKANGTGLTGYYFNSTSTAIGAGYSPNLFLPANLTATRNDATVDFNFATTGVTPAGVNSTYFTVRWQGQVQPQYSETYYFDTRTDDGAKLWVNGQLIIDKWVNQTVTDWIGSIDLQAGVLYDIKMEYYQSTSSREAHLNWFSNSQVKQIIPANRLYPATATPAAPSVTSPAVVYGFVNQPFSFTVTANNSANVATNYSLGASSGPLPPGLGLNANTGVISGTPTQAGDFQVAIVASNNYGTGSSVLDVQILATGNAITREIWTSGVTGSTMADMPLNLPPNSIDNTLSSAEDNTAYANNTAKRLRGYFTAPTTGNYYFWLAASNAAELWISNDNEAANKVRRAWVNAPGTNSETWNAQTNQKSAWLSLVAGQRYYFEVLHNHGTGVANSNLAVAYFLDATGTTANPVANNSGVVAGYLLSPYDYPVVAGTSDSLYATNMAPQGVATTTAVGSASLRLNAAHTQGILHFTYGGLSSPQTGYHVHTQAVGNNPSQIVLDIDDIDKFHPELRTADGGYIWNIVDTGTWTAANIVSAIQGGQTYLNIHTVNYPAGEIRGNFGLVVGSQTPPTPQADPGYNTGDFASDAGAARFLNQATFGASPSDVAYVKAKGYGLWLDNQFTLPASHLVPDVLANVSSDPTNLYPSTLTFNAWWRKSILAPDQLRQRVAFALSEILVVSDTGVLNNNGRILADYYDTLLDNAFGNFRDILKQVTLTSAMGIYLDMRGNAKGSLLTGLHPNENYAREIMQLFSFGLNRLWPDGTLVLNSAGNLVPTYNQDVIQGIARVFTGWNYGQDLQGTGRLPTNFYPSANYLDPMVLVPTQHELGAKLVLDNVVLPPAQGYSLTSAPVTGSEADPKQVAFDTYCLNDLEKAIDSMFNNSSVGPFVCRQLIQRLVSSNPSPSYLHRVVLKFNDDGSAQHVRGNMQAVLKAILLDGEARSTSLDPSIANTAGKQREPLLRLTGPARAFPVVATVGSYSQSGSTVLNVTTTTPHLLNSGNGVFLDFTGNTPIPFNNPTTTNYSVLSSPAPTTYTFSVSATGVLTTTYTQPVNSNMITVNSVGPARVGAKVYLNFLTGSAPSGLYSIASLPDSSHFTVTTNEDPATLPARSGLVVIPQLSAGYEIKNAGSPATATINVGTFVNHSLQAGDHVWLHFFASSGSLNTDAEFTVANIVDEDHFTVVVPNSKLVSEIFNTLTVYMLVPPPLTRSGNTKFEVSKYDVGYTDAYLLQTPLNAPTVFNFYYPDFKYPGPIAAANVTTPEFQLATDTNIVTLTNTLASSILSSSNTNGLTSYRGGTGTITMDLSPYMTATQTSDAGIPALVNQLGDLLTGGQLTSSTKTTIINLVANTANFPYTGAAPTTTQMRDRVRAVVHLIITMPEYAVQK